MPGLMLCYHLEMVFEQVALHFHSSLGPANYVCGADIWGTWNTNSFGSYPVPLHRMGPGFEMSSNFLAAILSSWTWSKHFGCHQACQV